MNIFESLENLNVSEECFNSIINMVEEIINEVSDEWKQQCANSAKEKREYFKKLYDRAKSNYESERSSKNGDAVLDASARSAEADKKEEKLKNAIEKHNKAKAEGRIKPAKKEDEDASNK